MAKSAGHDINYISLTGALHMIGSAEGKPVPPLNLVGDFGGGSMLLALGVVSAILQARMTGKGNVVDAAMVDGVPALLAPLYGLVAVQQPNRKDKGWDESVRAGNMLDGGAPFYDTYECRDGKFVSVGSIEPQFYALLLKLSGLDKDPVMDPKMRWSPSQWSLVRATLSKVFKTKTRDEWCALMEGTDVCFAPVLTLSESFEHPHARARGTYVNVEGVMQQAPAPRFSETPCAAPSRPPEVGEHTAEVLRDFGMDVEHLVKIGAVQDRSSERSAKL